MTSPAKSESGSSILVVEDEIEISRLFLEVLGNAGYRVVPAYSVVDALSSLASQPFDAAILDIELRDGPVFPVADHLAARGIPFLFASAVYFQAVPKRHQSAPFVTKPFSINELLHRVNSIRP
jgi:DNA-binding response OmpR family regulator